MSAGLSRRRFLAVAAAFGGLSLAPGGAGPARASRAALHEWRGTALGAEAAIRLAHAEPRAAERLIAACRREIARCERIFSLARDDSALARLNRDGRLESPPRELVRLLDESARIGARTGGAFDVTVQPLWHLYATHFTSPDADPAGPPHAAVDEALSRVDHGGMDVAPSRIRFAQPGMAVTLNGIAQGFITDRIADLLRAAGAGDVLVDMGEHRALGRHPAGRPWRVGLADPDAPWRPLRGVDLVDRALATSGGYGTRFDTAGRHHHLFDPRTGRSSHRCRSVSVIAPRAVLADALSTALAVAGPAGIAAALEEPGPVGVVMWENDGTVTTRGAVPA